MVSTEAGGTTKRMRGDGHLYRRGSTFWICVYVDGRQQRESCKTSDEEKAKKYLRNKLKEVHAHELDPARPFITQHSRRRTIGDLMDALEKKFRIDEKFTPQAKSQLKRVRADFAGVRALSLTKEDVDAYIERRLAEDHAKASINRTTQLLKQGFVYAKLPVPDITKLSEKGNERSGFFTRSEVDRVMSGLDSNLADFMLFGWLTGMRKNEIGSLRWLDVTGDEIRLRPENAKTGEGRTIPFEGELATLMERRKKARQFKIKDVVMISPFIFHRKGEPIREFRKSWRTACCFAGVGRMVCPKCDEQVDAKRKCGKCGDVWKAEELVYRGRIFHDLRRSAARNMLNAGVPQAIAMQITGHRTDSMFRRYAIVAPNDVRTALRTTQQHTANEMANLVAMAATVN